jgi:hypothetical protein
MYTVHIHYVNGVAYRTYQLLGQEQFHRDSGRPQSFGTVK